jgi:hypothetical protein
MLDIKKEATQEASKFFLPVSDDIAHDGMIPVQYECTAAVILNLKFNPAASELPMFPTCLPYTQDSIFGSMVECRLH